MSSSLVLFSFFFFSMYFNFLDQFSYIFNFCFLFKRLEKICLILDYYFINKFLKSFGSYGCFVNFEVVQKKSLLLLASGYYKCFFFFTFCIQGAVNVINFNKITYNKAGFFKNYGIKQNVRGIAMNPIDHPHGGRTKTVKYPRTPWGKTTKFK